MLNKKTDKYLVAKWLIDSDYHKITEYEALHLLGIKNLSARVSELRQLGLSIDSVLKKVIKKSTGRPIKVRDYYMIRKGCVGKFRERFKELTK